MTSTDPTSFASLPSADWSRRRLADADVRFCELQNALFVGVDAPGSFWEQCSLRRADLTGASFVDATLRDCVLERAVLRDTRFTGARLVRCSLDGAQLEGADFADATMVGCSLQDAELVGARNFSTARDMIVEVLRRAAGDDQDLIRWVGLVALKRDWCYDVWTDVLRESPRYRRLALDAFAEYPESGFSEALRSGAAPKAAEPVPAAGANR